MHIGHVNHDSAEILGRYFYTEVEGRLEDHRLSLHQSLSYRTVGGLSEVTALGVLKMRFACYKSYLHVGERRAYQNAAMYSLIHVREYQSLPV